MKHFSLLLASSLILTLGCYRKQKATVQSPCKTDTVYIEKDHAGVVTIGGPSLEAHSTQDWKGFKPADSLYFDEKIKWRVMKYTDTIYSKHGTAKAYMAYPVPDDTTIFRRIKVSDMVFIHGDTVTPKPSPLPDTTIKPRYEYGARYSIWMPLNKPYPPLDTINMVIEELLLDRTGREAAQFRAILSKQFASLLGRPTVDSVKIELPKK